MKTEEDLQQLTERIESARAASDAQLAIVRPDAVYERPIHERHRIIFYIGHLEAFDWNLIRTTLCELPSFNSEFDTLFAFGIDPTGGDMPSDAASDWPAIEYVHGYRRRIRSILDHEFARVGSSPQRDQILNVAIEHRLMHAETLAYMFHWLPSALKLPQAQPDVLQSPSFTPLAVDIPAGVATLGLPRGGPFGWDNEFVEHTVWVPEFAIDKYKITNAQFLEFVREGGYSDKSLWSDDDWKWKERERLKHPQFWIERGDAWRLRAMFGELPLPWNWPVYVSHAEASAYARWANKKLPTEAQWHRAAFGTPGGTEHEFPWGSTPPSTRHGNFNYQRWDPMPVNSHPEGASAFGIVDLVGNGWEWTSSLFAPFEQFEAFPFYPGYSANFFDGKHYVMKGGSARTAACMLRRSFRNWFQTHYPHIYAGFRCVSP